MAYDSYDLSMTNSHWLYPIQIRLDDIYRCNSKYDYGFKTGRTPSID